MKKQHIIWFLIGMGLLASMSSCKLNPTGSHPDIMQGLPDNEVRSIESMKEIDSCLNVAITYTKAADILDEYVALAEAPNCSRLLATKIQVQLLDSAAKYKKDAERLATGD